MSRNSVKACGRSATLPWSLLASLTLEHCSSPARESSGSHATTQLSPDGFTSGAIGEEHYANLTQAMVPHNAASLPSPSLFLSKTLPMIKFWQAPALIFDSEILHRGAATPPLGAAPAAAAPSSSPVSKEAARGGGGRGDGDGNGDGPLGAAAPPGAGWVSSCSVELCSFSGWEEWVRGTGGTEFSDAPEYRMLPIRASSAEDVLE